MKQNAIKKQGSTAVEYRNDMVKGKVIDPRCLQPIPVTSKSLQQKYGKYVCALNVQTTEEAALHATTMHIEANDLIKHTCDIMRNADQDLDQLNNY